MFLWMGYTGIQFHVYDTCMNMHVASATNSASASLACGSLAGFAATVATYPLDIIRTLCAQHAASVFAALDRTVPLLNRHSARRLAIFDAVRLLVSQVTTAICKLRAPEFPNFIFQRALFQGLPAALVNNVPHSRHSFSRKLREPLLTPT
jgi:hypothetical protein